MVPIAAISADTSYHGALCRHARARARGQDAHSFIPCSVARARGAARAVSRIDLYLLSQPFEIHTMSGDGSEKK